MQREVILIFGQTGSGKTTLAKNLIRTYPRVLVADAGFGDYAPIESAESYPTLLERLQEQDAFNTHKPFRIAYDFYPYEYDLAFATANRLGNCLLLLEEADRFNLDIAEYGESVFRGRHWGVSLALVSLHPRIIPTDVRRQATALISFRQIFPNDIAWLSEIIGEDAYKLSELPGPPQSPPHPYLLWTQAGGSKIIGAQGPIDKKPE